MEGGGNRDQIHWCNLMGYWRERGGWALNTAMPPRTFHSPMLTAREGLHTPPPPHSRSCLDLWGKASPPTHSISDQGNDQLERRFPPNPNFQGLLASWIVRLMLGEGS